MTSDEPTFNIQGGVHCADFIGRDQIIHGFSADQVEGIIAKLLDLLRAGGVLAPDPEGRLRVEADGETLRFQAGAAQTLGARRSRPAHLLAISIDKDFLAWATDFIPLRAEVDPKRTAPRLDIPLEYFEIHLPPPGAGPAAQPTQETLEDITQALTRHPAFVILGEPGCGKTTTLQKIAYEQAVAALRGESRVVPFFARLSQQHGDSPYGFLAKLWEQRIGGNLAEALAGGGVTLLLDGLNELPRDAGLPTRLSAWRDFVRDYGRANQIIFSGRYKDYAGHLNLPRVIVKELDAGRIADYLRRNQAEGLLDALEKVSPDARRRLQDLLENPLHLSMLAYYYRECGGELANRGQLFCWFATALIDRERILHSQNCPVDLPVPVWSGALAALGFAMQAQGVTALPLAQARALVSPQVEHEGQAYAIDAVALFRFARGARLLDPNSTGDVRFQHQMLHEYFAALELLRRFATGADLSRLWRAKRTVTEMPPATVGEWDALPEPPATGWEVTTLLACGLSAAPEKLIESVRPANPALAGRCLVEAGLVPGPDLAPVLAATQKDLLGDLYNPQLHLRARLQAGFSLGRIGDPRFGVREIAGVKLILPQMVAVPGGKYWIGSAKNDADAYDDEKPQTQVAVTPFSIGKWPVTNAEFAWFMRAGGYQEERYWQGELAKRWLKGEEVSGGQTSGYLRLWRQLQNLKKNPDWRQELKQSGNFTPDQLDTYEYMAGLSEEQLKAELGKSLSQKSRAQPAYWEDAQYNNPSQPVVGITWFEARAYCTWLGQVMRREWRLPSEVEWEAAARGLPGPRKWGWGLKKEAGTRVYPWGNEWDSGKANTLEGRVLRPSPVGAYAAAGGVGPGGIEDQAGNVWNWTSSLYLPYPYDPAKSEQSDSDGERVVRGGSWFSDRGDARCATRSRDDPVDFLYSVGFRVLSPGIFLDSGC